MKQRIHFADRIIMRPQDPISITIIGMGGTGTRLISELVRMNIMLLKLDHVGIHVTVMDGDKISDSNIGRQFFYNEDIGKFKAQTVIERINRNFGFNWDCVNEYMTHDNETDDPSKITNTVFSNFMVSCVDRIDPRIELSNTLNDNKVDFGYHNSDKPLYYIDCGNSFDQGQVICGTIFPVNQPKMDDCTVVEKLKGVFDVFSNDVIVDAMNSEDFTASCSTFEALQKQDPFINSTIASLASRIMWKLIKDHMITENGYFVNLSDPTPITSLKV